MIICCLADLRLRKKTQLVTHFYRGGTRGIKMLFVVSVMEKEWAKLESADRCRISLSQPFGHIAIAQERDGVIIGYFRIPKHFK